MREPLRKVTDGLLDFVFPPLCMHCRSLTAAGGLLLCEACLDTLDMINADERCRRCFRWMEERRLDRLCHWCLREPSPLDRSAAVFDYQGPVQTLVRQLKYRKRSYVAGGMAAYMVAQWEQLGWPMPDALVPVPMNCIKRFYRGYNHSWVIAQELAKILQKPVVQCLRRRLGGRQQAGLSRTERRQMSSAEFFLIDGTQVTDRRVLLVDDVMTTGSTLSCCADVLQGMYPASIYAMSFARAV